MTKLTPAQAMLLRGCLAADDGAVEFGFGKDGFARAGRKIDAQDLAGPTVMGRGHGYEAVREKARPRG